MQTAFSIALSGLTANTIAIDVTGNNLANLNTAGYKATTLSFHDLVAQSLGATPGQTQIGVGVGAPITLREFQQGAIQATGGPSTPRFRATASSSSRIHRATPSTPARETSR